MLLGKNGNSLAEIGKFFPAVVFQLEEDIALDGPDPKSQEGLVTFWLEVKSSSDPHNDGVKWQIDACRKGFEAYHRM